MWGLLVVYMVLYSGQFCHRTAPSPEPNGPLPSRVDKDICSS